MWVHTQSKRVTLSVQLVSYGWMASAVRIRWNVPLSHEVHFRLFNTSMPITCTTHTCHLCTFDIQSMLFSQCKCRSHHNLHKLSILFYENHFHLRPYKLIINLALSGIFLWSSLSIMDWTFNLMVEMRQLIAPDWCRRVWPQLESWHSMTMIS